MALSYLRGSGPDPFPGTSAHPVEVLELLGAYLDQARTILGLANWRIKVSRGTPNGKTASAETYFRDSATEAVVAFGPEFFSFDEPDRRAILAHELLHCWMHQLTSWARDAVEGELGQRWETLFESSIGELEEQVVDGLAHAIAPLLPESPAAPA